MSFIEAVKSVYGNYAKFDGRATRSEYWWFVAFSFLMVGYAIYREPSPSASWLP